MKKNNRNLGLVDISGYIKNKLFYNLYINYLKRKYGCGLYICDHINKGRYGAMLLHTNYYYIIRHIGPGPGMNNSGVEKFERDQGWGFLTPKCKIDTKYWDQIQDYNNIKDPIIIDMYLTAIMNHEEE